MATARTDLEGDIVVDAIVEAGAFQQFVDTLAPIVDECKLHFDEDGAHVMAVDPANVAMVGVDLDTDAFEAYDAGRVTIGIDLRRLDERLGVANAGDLVQLRVNMETRMLDLEIRHIDQSIRLIDPDSIRKEPDIPDGLDEKMTTEAVIEGAALDEAVTVADMVCDHIFFESDLEARTVAIGAEDDIDESVATFGADELIFSDVSEDGRALLSIDYVKDLVKPIPPTAEVTIRHGTEFPVFFEYEACEGSLSVTDLTAPRIQSE